MKILQVEKAATSYEFRYLELVRVIEVTKAGRFAYLIKHRPGLFYCNCPGARYHGKCWHTSMINQLMKQPRVSEPWVEWADDAGVIQYSK